MPSTYRIAGQIQGKNFHSFWYLPSAVVLEEFVKAASHHGQWDLGFHFLSWIGGARILPGWMNLLLQRNDSARQPVGCHADAYQPEFSKVVNLSDELEDFKHLAGVGLGFPGGSLEGGLTEERRKGWWVIRTVEPL